VTPLKLYRESVRRAGNALVRGRCYGGIGVNQLNNEVRRCLVEPAGNMREIELAAYLRAQRRG